MVNCFPVAVKLFAIAVKFEIIHLKID